MGPSSLLVFGGALTLFLGAASGQSPVESCVQVSDVSYVAACPCDAGSDFSFQIEGATTVTANTVNVAVVVDASGSVSADDYVLEKEFAKNAVASFASRNLFENGGTASFAQFSSSASVGGSFTSSADFDAFVDADPKVSGGTDIVAGLARGRELLNASPSTASFLILITDGAGNDPTDEANAARAEGTIVYAVGVGPGPSQATLEAIGGDPANVFDIDEFSELDTALADIIDSTDGSIPCASTGAVVTLEFNAMVAEATVAGGVAVPASISGSTVVFEVPDLEGSPTSFAVVLETCGEMAGDPIVASVTYVDDEANVPDLTSIQAEGVVSTCVTGGTPSPTTSTREMPTPVPVAAPVVDFSYSYSYAYDPYDDVDDDSTDVDPTVPGPAPVSPGTAPTAPGTAPTSPGTAPTTPGTAPTAPGTAPTAPGTAPTSPGTAPTAPGTAPTSPGTAPTSRGTAPTSPGTAPTSPGTAPTAPGTAPTAPGTAPTAPGTAPTAPGTAPTSPGTAPTAPGTAPTSPGTAPTSRGTAPTSPGTAPTAPGAAPTAPGTAPTSPGTAPTAPGTAPTAPGTAPTAPGTAPTAPGTAPTAPGTAPTAPGTAPTAPGTAPTAPGTAPTAPGTAPTAPGTAPTSPGTAPTAPGTAPTAPGTAPTSSMTCSNGVYGVENAKATVCCDAGCGVCGGPGCSTVGAPSLGADDCCVTEITGYGQACSVTGTAPCFIDGDSPVPAPTVVAAPTAMPVMAPTRGGPVSSTVMPAVVPTGGTTCSNGIYGLETGGACCVAECGVCGGPGCSRIGAPALDADDCCVTEIVHFGEACSVTGAAPCYLDDGAVPGPAPTMPSPVAPTDEDNSYSFSYTYESWYDDDGVGMTCSNGVYGVENAKATVCCDAGCGVCGGPGCSTVGAPSLGADDCCVTEIIDYGQACSATGTAPCVIDRA